MGTPSSLFGMSPAVATPAASEAASLGSGASTGLNTAATAAEVPAGSGAHPAPWGTVCLALLLQRCFDKSTAVRAKALHALAEAVHAMLGAMPVMDATHAEQCRRVSSLSLARGVVVTRLAAWRLWQALSMPAEQ